MRTSAASTAPASIPHYTARETRHRIFSIVAASSGNLVEWFDFYVYAFTLLYFASAFFPKSDPTAQLLNTAGVFAAGFLMRPHRWLVIRADRRSQGAQDFDGDRGDDDVLFLIVLALAIVSFYTSISGIVKAEMFPAEVRALGVGSAYAIANAIFGGSAEYVALGLKSVGHESAFFWYVTVMMAIAFLVALRLPSQPNFLHDDH